MSQYLRQAPPPKSATYTVDCWNRLDRFLILGTEGGSYYATEKDLTFQNIKSLEECLAADGPATVTRIQKISLAGRAPKNDAALYALAMAASSRNMETRQAALSALPSVARTGTHLLHFIGYVDGMRGWGRALKRAVGQWFLAKPPLELFYQAAKYRQRDKWALRDALRLAHPKVGVSLTAEPYIQQDQNLILEWITKGWPDADTPPPGSSAVSHHIAAFEQVQRAKTAEEAIPAIGLYSLPRECIPTPLLTSPGVWQTLLPNLGQTALIRNLPTLTRLNMLQGTNKTTILNRITNREAIKKGRVHPLQLLVAALTYKAGRSLRGDNTWKPDPDVVQALDAAYYLAFDYVEPTNRHIVVGLDVSGSMTSGNINGIPGFTPRCAAAALAMTLVRTEPHVTVLAFSAGSSLGGPIYGTGPFNLMQMQQRYIEAQQSSLGIIPFSIEKTDTLSQVMERMNYLPFSCTDCALPMRYAQHHAIRAVDAFYILTDSEHNSGPVSPMQALDSYRQWAGRQSRFVVQALVANNISVADPQDPLSMDINGFDAATPALLASFIRGDI